ncbi:hypothetical protein NMG29_38425 [Streptomyces cocklensis]|uniref:Uncharacterized protein n=1 Tax=Actinacidiphila cocklensis TaxID=887465 RepID=A0A9W4DVX2_9ACTN|nr:hypothetical protein [Actinacidiphila cocklensis]MDD1063977.1 hypothetical protein [Actinacidiphila cocklensis]WSX78669.1 hypothetical protein OH826_35390 [Streptomyces sp. NBC_00899]CAG6396906.1 hypothetical protein SCOCK_490019 [Actinacidiphila cocklensis]
MGESLRVGGVLENVPLQVTKVQRVEVGNTGEVQPTRWTLLHDGSCGDCRGAGESGGVPCGTCNGGGFSLIDDPEMP